MFGFSDIVHKQFNQNFLKTVVFQISFTKIEDFNTKKEEIIGLFNAAFPRVNTPSNSGFETRFNSTETPIVQQVKSDGTIEMKSESGQKVLVIDNSSLSLTISGREYKNYTELKKLIININKFFEYCDITETHRVAIRKINIVEFNYSTDSNSSEIFGTVINERLLGDSSYLPKSQFINQNMHLLIFEKETYHLNLRYGLNIPQVPSRSIAQVIIDIDLFNNATTPISDLVLTSDKINKEIFNAFNWSINETFLNLLNDVGTDK